MSISPRTPGKMVVFRDSQMKTYEGEIVKVYPPNPAKPYYPDCTSYDIKANNGELFKSIPYFRLVKYVEKMTRKKRKLLSGQRRTYTAVNCELYPGVSLENCKKCDHYNGIYSGIVHCRYGKEEEKKSGRKNVRK
jgi:hypothetical protein